MGTRYVVTFTLSPDTDPDLLAHLATDVAARSLHLDCVGIGQGPTVTFRVHAWGIVEAFAILASVGRGEERTLPSGAVQRAVFELEWVPTSPHASDRPRAPAS